MPVYDFRCRQCGEFEVWRSLSEMSLPVYCPTCGASAQRIYTPPAVALNGPLRLERQEQKEPRLVRQERDPEKPRFRLSTCGRPWMIGH
ncbi:MAG: zinc ribbon domain-containing protein [Gloeomargarita sp. SKYB31]|nr:zinc ribbon domain-containing protein [Gloeomargarita sp. SKYB31]